MGGADGGADGCKDEKAYNTTNDAGGPDGSYMVAVQFQAPS